MKSHLLFFARELQRATTFEELLLTTRAEVVQAGYEHAWLVVATGDDMDEMKLLDYAGAIRGTVWEVAPLLKVAGDAMLEEMVRSDTPVVVADARTDPRTDKRIVEQLGNRTIINIPLRLVDKPFGAFGTGTFGDEGCRPPTAEQLDYLIGMASQLSVAVGRIRLLEERARAGEKLKQAEERYRSLLESAPDAMVIVDGEGGIVLVNGQTEKLFGYPREELVGKPADMLLHERSRARESAPGEGFFASSTPRPMGAGFEIFGLRKTGTEFPVEISLSPAVTPEGTLVTAAIRDVSQRKQAEEALRRAEEKLRQGSKMDAIGSLAGGVAHDFNNLLSVILSYVSLILGELKPGDPIRTDLGEVKKAGERAADLTRQLLAFGRQQMLEPKVLDLNQVIAEMETMLRRILGEDIDLSLLTLRGLGRVKADPSQIEQIIMNLVVNARDAMPRGGKLSLETANVTLDAAYADDHPGVTEGRYVMLAVTDGGVGMEQAVCDRIFEPFFTTKEKGKGTGLGLSTVFGIVKQSGGHIWVYSELGEGTTFKIYLPRSDEAAETISLSPPPFSSLRGSETILLVEDEEQVRALARTILRRNGYNVLEAQNGGEAFLVCEQYRTRIHLLLTDVVMPRMSGPDLAQRLAPLRPELRVLFMSGYTDSAVVHHGVLEGGVAFLQKPITPDSLLRKVREVLDLPPHSARRVLEPVG